MDDKYNYFTPNIKLYMVIMAILSFIILFYNVILGVVVLVFCVGLIIYNIEKMKVKKNEWKKFIEGFSSKLDIATKNTLVKLPFALVIISEKGNILWYNQQFNLILDDEEILGKDIRELVKEFNVKRALNKKVKKFSYMNINDNYYDIYVTTVNMKEDKDNEEKIMLLYFTDITEKFNLLQDIRKNRESVMIIEVDNLEEVIKTTEEDKKPLLAAEIERKINSYAQGLQAMIKKYSNNKYILTIQDKYIEEEMDKKFDILDDIRDLNIGNKLSATLSIGVGRNGDTPLNNYKLSMSAIELALGRGGDQVVVKNKDKLSFYGGKTKEVEKRTKVRARVIAHALVELINESSNILIMGHINPDIDCLGAAVGINSTIRLLEKECYIVLDKTNNGIESMIKKLQENTEYNSTFISSENAKKIVDDNTLLILVDVHGSNYVQNIDIVERCSRVVIIDHHRKGTNFIDKNILSYVEPYASSTCELVTEMIQYMVDKPKLKSVEAAALLAGICVDTKNFYFKTGVRTFEAAAFLRKLGADTIDIKKIFSHDLDEYVKKLEIIKSAKVENKIAIAVCPQNIKDTIIAAQAADELLNITGIQVSFVLVQIDNNIFISGRSLGDINVQVILEKLGGGGHMTMAGAKLSDISIEEALQRLQSGINNYLKESEK
ncbi:DHH family phosphoesterase [Haloimpatiens sp. FM7330]|uniref:DHH family phosphoesterase n=1 Tax=Haloimpatiens sp. FM7330 TaxID=3298610 RepID=UPI0036390855